MRDHGHGQRKLDLGAVEVDPFPRGRRGSRSRRWRASAGRRGPSDSIALATACCDDRVQISASARDRLHFVLDLARLAHDVRSRSAGVAAGPAHRHLQDRDAVAGAALSSQRHGHVGDERPVGRACRVPRDSGSSRCRAIGEHHVVDLGVAALRDGAHPRAAAASSAPGRGAAIGARLQHVGRRDERRGQSAGRGRGRAGPGATAAHQVACGAPRLAAPICSNPTAPHPARAARRRVSRPRQAAPDRLRRPADAASGSRCP